MIKLVSTNLSTFASGHTGKSLSAIEKQYYLFLYSEFPLLTLKLTSQNWQGNIIISTQNHVISELSTRLQRGIQEKTTMFDRRQLHLSYFVLILPYIVPL